MNVHLESTTSSTSRKLGKWLEANGLVDAEAAADMVEWGTETYDELPKAEKLYRESQNLSPLQLRSISDDDWIEDQLVIERVEPGELWFEGAIGPVRVTKQVADLARPGWWVTISLARIRGEWRIAEVGNVYP